ncbi:hypothetical protein P7C70_g8872, partial [Phenoliferia sp. Uapishka_3]
MVFSLTETSTSTPFLPFIHSPSPPKLPPRFTRIPAPPGSTRSPQRNPPKPTVPAGPNSGAPPPEPSPKRKQAPVADAESAEEVAAEVKELLEALKKSREGLTSTTWTTAGIMMLVRRRLKVTMTLWQAHAAWRVLRKYDVYVQAPCGEGKFLVFQAVAICCGLDGRMVFVVEPLDAVGSSQVIKNKSWGISSISVTSESLSAAIPLIRDRKVAIVYLSPEILSSIKTLALIRESAFRGAVAAALERKRATFGYGIPWTAFSATTSTEGVTACWRHLAFGQQPFWGIDLGSTKPKMSYLMLPDDWPSIPDNGIRSPMADILSQSHFFLPSTLSRTSSPSDIDQFIVFAEDRPRTRNLVHALVTALPPKLKPSVVHFTSGSTASTKQLRLEDLLNGQVVRGLGATDAFSVGMDASFIKKVATGKARDGKTAYQQLNRAARDRAEGTTGIGIIFAPSSHFGRKHLARIKKTLSEDQLPPTSSSVDTSSPLRSPDPVKRSLATLPPLQPPKKQLTIKQTAAAQTVLENTAKNAAKVQAGMCPILRRLLADDSPGAHVVFDQAFAPNTLLNGAHRSSNPLPSLSSGSDVFSSTSLATSLPSPRTIPRAPLRHTSIPSPTQSPIIVDSPRSSGIPAHSSPASSAKPPWGAGPSFGSPRSRQPQSSLLSPQSSSTFFSSRRPPPIPFSFDSPLQSRQSIPSQHPVALLRLLASIGIDSIDANIPAIDDDLDPEFLQCHALGPRALKCAFETIWAISRKLKRPDPRRCCSIHCPELLLPFARKMFSADYRSSFPDATPIINQRSAVATAPSDKAALRVRLERIKADQWAHSTSLYRCSTNYFEQASIDRMVEYAGRLRCHVGEHPFEMRKEEVDRLLQWQHCIPDDVMVLVVKECKEWREQIDRVKAERDVVLKREALARAAAKK